MKWLHTAIALIEADYQRSADTHLIALPLPGFARYGIDRCLASYFDSSWVQQHFVDCTAPEKQIQAQLT